MLTLTEKELARQDKDGYTTRVRRFPTGYRCSVIKDAKYLVHSTVASRREIGVAFRAMLRMIDKMGNPSEMASASRDRWIKHPLESLEGISMEWES